MLSGRESDFEGLDLAPAVAEARGVLELRFQNLLTPEGSGEFFDWCAADMHEKVGEALADFNFAQRKAIITKKGPSGTIRTSPLGVAIRLGCTKTVLAMFQGLSEEKKFAIIEEDLAGFLELASGRGVNLKDEVAEILFGLVPLERRGELVTMFDSETGRMNLVKMLLRTDKPRALRKVFEGLNVQQRINLIFTQDRSEEKSNNLFKSIFLTQNLEAIESVFFGLNGQEKFTLILVSANAGSNFLYNGALSVQSHLILPEILSGLSVEQKMILLGIPNDIGIKPLFVAVMEEDLHSIDLLLEGLSEEQIVSLLLERGESGRSIIDNSIFLGSILSGNFSGLNFILGKISPHKIGEIVNSRSADGRTVLEICLQNCHKPDLYIPAQLFLISVGAIDDSCAWALRLKHATRDHGYRIIDESKVVPRDFIYFLAQNPCLITPKLVNFPICPSSYVQQQTLSTCGGLPSELRAAKESLPSLFEMITIENSSPREYEELTKQGNRIFLTFAKFIDFGADPFLFPSGRNVGSYLNRTFPHHVPTLALLLNRGAEFIDSEGKEVKRNAIIPEEALSTLPKEDLVLLFCAVAARNNGVAIDPESLIMNHYKNLAERGFRVSFPIGRDSSLEQSSPRFEQFLDQKRFGKLCNQDAARISSRPVVSCQELLKTHADSVNIVNLKKIIAGEEIDAPCEAFVRDLMAVLAPARDVVVEASASRLAGRGMAPLSL